MLILAIILLIFFIFMPTLDVEEGRIYYGPGNHHERKRSFLELPMFIKRLFKR